MLNILDKVVLEDKKEYVVASSARIAEENFYLIIDTKDNKNMKYVRESKDGKTLSQIHDLELLGDIAIVLYANAKKFYLDKFNK